MELGQKIKAARQELGLSQRQLCGERITRNMLSQIENGSARPSMDTLAYLASRLGRSVSYFLEEQAVVSPNMAVMAHARHHHARQEYRKALDTLEQYHSPDALFDTEQQLLVLLCCIAEAEAALAQDRIPYARQMLERTESLHCPYLTEPLRLQLRLLRFRCAMPFEGSLSWDALLYARAQAEPHKALGILQACSDQASPDWHLRMANALFARGEYSAAREHYLACEEAFPQAAIPNLEQCFRELGDYKKAYEYAIKQR